MKLGEVKRMKFGEIIRNRRTFRRLSIDRLSNITGYNISTLSSFEQSRNMPVTYSDVPKGVLLNNNIEVFNDYLKFCRLADALGFDSIELEEIIKVDIN